ncbi:long-chain-alcohol oxidase FAO4A-like [Tripterygium wilfordii]|uniref:Long-chain-alcohol oxidase n=1 Tax=Tripterygium wilfordii TaxID=458696 RepID=A0A7J7DSJ6_TRIWF|nr:long-chain-alcohol oxidase FAO4A [Tripterygium wilfordii]KAF5749114.1 long-chain-alcohol oxidase FAO4A-like [Tripterygium wilfordii]
MNNNKSLKGGDSVSIDAEKLQQELLNMGFGGYANSLSARQMESLSALCDTLLPSIDVADEDVVDSSLSNFYRTSASMAATPQRVGGLISERMRHPRIWLMKVCLWLLSTCIGTLILCGRHSFSTRFPYVHSFARLPPHKRQQITLSWSLSFFFHLRTLFLAIKLLTLLVFFTQVDEKNENLSWKAIGYTGPDPDFRKKPRTPLKIVPLISKDEELKCKGDADHHNHNDQSLLFGPLYRGLIDIKLPTNFLAESLQQFGFPVSVNSPKTAIANPSMVIQCDAVVVGSGSGGGVIAGVLAKAGYKVLVLEKGNYCARTNLSLLEGPSMDQMYLNGGLTGTHDLGIVVLAGSTVGGGSAINWSASIQTPKHVISEWSNQCELEFFDSKLYREAMDIVCERMGVQSGIDEEGFNNEILRRGCEETGYNVKTIPRNSTSDHYCGWCGFGCKDGRKKGTAETWLMDLVDSGNGAILPGCEVIKVLQKKRNGRKTATGVAFEFDSRRGKEMCFVESKVTIVACGALSTPALLTRSGLKNPNIGRNLHLHPVTMAWGYFPDNSEWPNKEKRSYEGGIMTAMSSVFHDSGYGAVIQTPSLHPGMFSVLMPWTSGLDIKKRMTRFSRTTHIFALARDRGSGTVKSPSSITYQMEDLDEMNLQKGLGKILRILAAAGAEEIGTHHCRGKTLNVKKVSSNEFERFVKEESSRPLRDLSTPICSAHQMGSCRMGVDPKKSAVNPMGETWEVEGLFVADASVFPTALGVNPMVTVQAIAYCTAQSVLEVLRRKKSRS